MTVPSIDADAHIMEGPDAWKYLDAAYADRRPLAFAVEDRPALNKLNAFWLIDGRVFPTPTGRGVTVLGTPPISAHAKRKTYSLESQDLTSVEARLDDNDKFGIDVQVIYSTVFLCSLTEDPRFEAALMRSYNSWLAEQCGKSGGRLRFAAVIPARDADEARKEIRRAREIGASSLALYGTVRELPLHDVRFDPVWEEACRVGLPVAIHVGNSLPGLTNLCDSINLSLTLSLTMPVLVGFATLMGGGVFDRFPDLRVAFLEAGSEWLPYLVRRMDHAHAVVEKAGWGYTPRKTVSEYLQSGNVFLTCECEDRLDDVLNVIGEDQIMLSSDIPHFEGEEDPFGSFRKRRDVSEGLRAKILGENAARFYRLA
jgi:predicted TIM-barrel fold metal-dependent hydrolase